MAIEIRGIGKDRVLSARVSDHIGGALASLRVAPVAARITFFDDNGPKGGLGMRCALDVRVPYRPAIRIERVAATRRLAFDQAFASATATSSVARRNTSSPSACSPAVSKPRAARRA